ncbi:uncharacterized protein [Dysidea avara]|uniref:uncharacterized protein isoform X2 n=1 Tax=Dysidea avara TaxID=196820 RepID=UPI00332DDBAA
MADSVGTKWYDLGIELLDDKDCDKLDAIQSDHSKDVSSCCTQMFKLWLNLQPSASWNQLIQALREPNIGKDGLAKEIETKIKSINQGIISSQSNAATQCHSAPDPPLPSLPVLTFSSEEDIDYAFSRLSAGVKKMIENSGCKFNILQDACIERALSPKSYMSGEIKSKISEAASFQHLCTMLTNAYYWNFLDTRMMEALVAASAVPNAQESLQNFRKAFFGLKLSEVLPAYTPVIPVRPGNVLIQEHLDVDPKQFTIGDLHKHRFYLETDMLKTGEGTITGYKILLGSVFIVWQIHVDHAYQVYTSLNKNRFRFQAQRITHLSIPAAMRWVKLPVLLRGQKLDIIGPIEEPLKCHPREDPFPLPEGLKWTWLSPEEAMHYDPRKKRKKSQWITSHPHFKKHYYWGVISKRGDSILSCAPDYICVGGISFSVMSLELTSHSFELLTSTSYDDTPLQMTGEMLKEVVNTTKEDGISQAVLLTGIPCIVKPVVVLTMWYYYFRYPLSLLQPPLTSGSPKTIGLRKITPKDVPKALEFTNQYAAQFEIHQLFQTEEEFSHHFLCPSMPGYIVTYIVEDPITNHITDLFGFLLYNNGNETAADVIAILATKSSPRQLVIDLLICAKQEKSDRVCTAQYGLPRSTFEHLFLNFANKYLHIYNYAYPEVDEEKCCLFKI